MTQPGGKGRGKDPLVGKTLAGRFEIEELINRGGMGKIYRAKQMPLGRAVALKVLDIHDDGSEFRDRFFLEASLCAKLAHPNTIRIYDYGTTEDGIYFIAMEYIAGESLQQLLNRVGSMAPARALSVAMQIAGALAEAHDTGIVHRDLKPGNVMLTAHGETEFVKVLDFGLVKELGKESELSRTGTVLGSPLYIAPEQVHGTTVDGRADIYTMGLILYAMLMGKTAFEKGNPLHVLMQQTQKRPPPFRDANPDARVPGCLEWVVMTCLEKKPKDRFKSMHEVLRALKACSQELRGAVSSVKLELRNGAVVLPEGMDVSVVALPGVASGSTTRLTRPTEAEAPPAEAPAESTLMSSRPIRTVAMVVGGGSIFGSLLIVIASVLIVLVLAGILITRPTEPVATVPVEEPQLRAPPPPAPAPVPVVAEEVEVTLTSTPDGASVERDGVLLGSTPFTIRLEPGKEMALEVTASGYNSQKVVLSSDVRSPKVTLKRRPRPTSKPKPPPAPEPVPEPVPAPAPEPAPQPEPKPAYDGVDMKDPFGDD